METFPNRSIKLDHTRLLHKLKSYVFDHPKNNSWLPIIARNKLISLAIYPVSSVPLLEFLKGAY